MTDVIGELVEVLGALVNNLDPYCEGFCIVCGCPQPDQKRKHDHNDDCTYVAAKKEWESLQVSDGCRSTEDLT